MFVRIKSDRINIFELLFLKYAVLRIHAFAYILIHTQLFWLLCPCLYLSVMDVIGMLLLKSIQQCSKLPVSHWIIHGDPLLKTENPPLHLHVLSSDYTASCWSLPNSYQIYSTDLMTAPQLYCICEHLIYSILIKLKPSIYTTNYISGCSVINLQVNLV